MLNWLDDKFAIRSFLILLLLLLLFQNNQHDKGTAPLNILMVESWSSTSTSTSTAFLLFPRRLCRADCTGGCHQIVNTFSKQKQQPSALDSSSSCHRRIDIVRSKVSFPTVLAAPADIHSDGTTTDDEDHPRTDDDNTIDRSEVKDSDNTTNDDQDQEEAEEEDEYMEIESLSSDQILELIELSFFQACFALSKGDSEPLKLFIVAVKTAAKKFEKASAIAITKTVNSLPSSIGRPLEEQEQELRDTWIQAIYLMLGHTLALGDDDFVVVNDGTTTNKDTNSVADLYGPILDDLVAIHNTGMGLNVNQFISTRKDILMPPKNKKKDNNPLMLEENDENDDLVQLAVVTQTVKLLYTTLEVLEGEGSDKYSYAVEEDDDEPASSSSSSSSTSTGRGFG